MVVQLPLLHSGKVRDVYDAGQGRLLFVTSDRVSAFDVVMREAIPQKGRVLTAMSAFWFNHLSDVCRNHLIAIDIGDMLAEAQDPWLSGRSMLCRRVDMLPIEAIVRGYLTGSAWKEYRTAGTIHGESAQSGLVEFDRLPEPIFTPSTKATAGHDVNMALRV